MLSLEKYKGSASRFNCPACGAKKRFTRYIDTETGGYLADHVGRCDRESSCGYHLRPKDFFAENQIQTAWMPRRRLQAVTVEARRNGRSDRVCEARKVKWRPDFINRQKLIETLKDYDRNSFVQFLLRLFPFDTEDVEQAVNEYLIGTTRKGDTVFPLIDPKGRVRSAQLMRFDLASGKRKAVRRWIDRDTGELKELKVFWLHKELGLADFELEQCLFGEHLLSKYPRRPIAIVEAAKSAVIASICKAVFPDMIWLACGGKSTLNAVKLDRLGRDRRIILFPDADGFEKWQAVAKDASNRGLAVKVSDLIERHATPAEKADKFDLADYLIREQQKRNDPARREAFRDLIEERLSILTIDGGLSEAEAEAAIVDSGFYAEAIRIVCHVCG